MFLQQKALVVMVGLPGRGKSFLARKLAHYFQWIGLETKVFAHFKKELLKQKHESFLINDFGEAIIIINEILRWFDAKQCGLAIYDAINHDVKIRQEIIDMANKKQLPLLFIECDCLLDNIDIDISAELEKELVSHTEIDMAVLYKSLYKKLSHFTSVAENENIPFIRLLYKNFNFEIKTYGKMGYLFRTILQYLIRFRFGKYDVYVLWHNYGDKDPLKKISVEGVDYARKLVKKFQGKTMRIYSGTEMVNIDIFNMLVEKVKLPFDTDMRQVGAHLLKALDEKESGLYFNKLTYQQIVDSFLNNPEIASLLKERRLNTDMMCNYEIDRIIIDAHNQLSPEMSYYYNVLSDNDLKKRLISVVCEIDSHNENRLVIASKPIISALATYFIEENNIINFPEKNCLVRFSSTKNHLSYVAEIVSI